MYQTLTLVSLLVLQAIVSDGFSVQNRTHETHLSRNKRAEKCYGELGCFDTQQFWHPVHRPVSLLPQSREKIGTRFGLYTRANKPTEKPKPQFLKVFDDDSIKNSYFDASKPIKFLIHGFLDTGFVKWVNELGNAILNVDDVNVIAVDWSRGNGLPYTQASANTWIVGGEIWLLSKYLVEKFGVKYENIHIIGHSLGAHIAGDAGSRMEGKAGRVTGLDPAEPWFQYMPEHVRLDEKDAKFVDVIHTDAQTILLLGFGMIQPVGHLDFYPNKGMEQPGCNVGGAIESIVDEGFEEGVRQLVACNHQRAIDMFTESIQSSCPFVGHECYDYDYFLKGRCRDCGEDGTKCAKMGYYANQHPDPTGVINRKLFLSTESKDPFCVYHYTITIVMEETSKQKDEKGLLKVNLYGQKGSHLFELNSETMDLKRGRRYQFVVTHRLNLGVVDKVDFTWKRKKSILDPGSWFHKGELYVKDIVVEPMDTLELPSTKSATTVCPTTSGALKSDSTYTFKTSTTCKDEY